MFGDAELSRGDERNCGRGNVGARGLGSELVLLLIGSRAIDCLPSCYSSNWNLDTSLSHNDCSLNTSAPLFLAFEHRRRYRHHDSGHSSDREPWHVGQLSNFWKFLPQAPLYFNFQTFRDFFPYALLFAERVLCNFLISISQLPVSNIALPVPNHRMRHQLAPV